MSKRLNVTRRDFIKKTAIVTAITVGAGSIMSIPRDSFAKKITHRLPPIVLSNVETVNGKKVKWIDHPTKEEKLFIPRVRLPLIAQNGAFVPITIEVGNPQTDKLYLKTFYIYDLNNPFPRAASFDLTPGNGTAFIKTRIKLQQESYVQVLAEYSNGDVYGYKRKIKVTLGGC
ncbi:thiosulfate oxidation carrier protein SoxY [Candidatus Acidulodesulfobacterium sp. H_13]|uniref:thiosulfate oxidation carrier protein SoxY n=1 Tax=Candidatus Acidulodesulfobacterium sp. H_13 TaxID=3395470 RepID=UPI003AF42DC3